LKILVVGGAGYIGSATSAQFIDAGHQVVVFDSLVTGHRAAIPAAATFVQGDLGDARAIDAAIDAHQPDAVAHFAAFIEAGESMQKPGKYYRNNVANTINLLDAMAGHGVDKIVFSSTAGVYASKDTPLCEDDPISPANVYAETKLTIERMLSWYRTVYGLKYAALRYFNAAGAMLDGSGAPLRGEAHQPETHLIPLILQVPLGQREAIYLFGTDYPTPDGTCIRDYIHIEDLASAHVLALDALDTQGAMTYNLGTGTGYSVREVVEVAEEITGQAINAVETERRPGDAPILIARADKIQNELGWQPRHPNLTDIMASAWNWHETHPHGYQEDNQQP